MSLWFDWHVEQKGALPKVAKVVRRRSFHGVAEAQQLREATRTERWECTPRRAPPKRIGQRLFVRSVDNAT